MCLIWKRASRVDAIKPDENRDKWKRWVVSLDGILMICCLGVRRTAGRPTHFLWPSASTGSSGDTRRFSLKRERERRRLTRLSSACPHHPISWWTSFPGGRAPEHLCAVGAENGFTPSSSHTSELLRAAPAMSGARLFLAISLLWSLIVACSHRWRL